MKSAIPNTKYKILNIGFTLIELLVVISIIGILTTLVAANLNSARSRARDAQRKSDLKNISTALRLYFNDNGKFPDRLPFGEGWVGTGSTVYMNPVPDDPLPDKDYYYRLDSSDTFTLTACLENESDKQGKTTLNSGISCDSNWMYQVVQQ